MIFFLRKIFTVLIILTSGYLYADVSVIIHPSNTNTLTHKDVYKIFLGKKKSFSSGAQAIPINLSEGNKTRQEFNLVILEKTNKELKSYWSKLIFTGKGTPPKEVNDENEIITLISNNPNLIGYINSDKVTDSVKVVYSF